MTAGRTGQPLQRLHLPVLDVSVTTLDAEAFLEWLAARRSHRRLVVYHNLHSVYLFHTDDGLAELYDGADVINIDGFPVLAAARFASRGVRAPYPVRRLENVDWIPGLASASFRVAVIGGTSAGNAGLVRRLRSGGVEAIGWDGFAGRDELVADDLEALRRFRPDIVIVGMGMPVQEQFLRDHWLQLPEAATYVTVGAAIDQLGGVDRHAPKWMRKIGLAWAWRLAREPRRMWRRYLLEPLLLARVLWCERGRSHIS